MAIDIEGEDKIYDKMDLLVCDEDPMHLLDPDMRFKFDQVNTETIKTLLIGLNQDKFTNSEVSKLEIFDIFTNIIIEALQFLGFIPYSLESDIEEI